MTCAQLLLAALLAAPSTPPGVGGGVSVSVRVEYSVGWVGDRPVSYGPGTPVVGTLTLDGVEYLIATMPL